MYSNNVTSVLPQGVELVVLRDARTSQPEIPTATGKIPMAKAYAIGVKISENIDGAMFTYTVEKFGDKVSDIKGSGDVLKTIVCITDGEPSGYPENGMRLAHVKVDEDAIVKVDIYQIGIVNYMDNLHVVIDKTYSDIVFFKDDKGNVVCDELPGKRWETLRGWFAGIFAKNEIQLSKRPYKRKDKAIINAPKELGHLTIVFHNLLMGYAIGKAKMVNGTEVSVMIPKGSLPVIDPKKPVALKSGTLCSFKRMEVPAENSRTNCDYVAFGVLIAKPQSKPEAKPVAKKTGEKKQSEPNGKAFFGKLSGIFGKK